MVQSTEEPVPQPAPKSVRNAVALLRLQATIWALLAAGIVAAGSANLALTPSSKALAPFVATVVFTLAMGTFAAAKLRLAYRLPRGTHQTRQAVITVETLMACFAGLLCVPTLAAVAAIFGLIIFPPILIGGIMSAQVARGLTKPPALQYFDAAEAAKAPAANQRSPEGGNQAQFWGYLATA